MTPFRSPPWMDTAAEGSKGVEPALEGMAQEVLASITDYRELQMEAVARHSPSSKANAHLDTDLNQFYLLPPVQESMTLGSIDPLPVVISTCPGSATGTYSKPMLGQTPHCSQTRTVFAPLHQLHYSTSLGNLTDWLESSLPLRLTAQPLCRFSECHVPLFILSPFSIHIVF